MKNKDLRPQRYRDMAEEIRSIADDVRNATTAESMRRIADDYEKMAVTRERLEQVPDA